MSPHAPVERTALEHTMIRHALRGGLPLLALLFCGGQEAFAQPKVKPLAIGEKLPPVPPAMCAATCGQSTTSRASALVLVFVGTECPVSNLYLPELIAWEKGYRTKQVQFLLVFIEQEDLDQVAAHAYDRDVPFPGAQGRRSAVVRPSRRDCVPTVVVLDGDYVLRYRGRVNDQYGVGAPAAGDARGPAPGPR